MNAHVSIARAVAAISLALPLLAAAQNVAIVNGKAVPKARLDFLVKQATQNGQPATPALEQQARDQVVMREVFAQEAERRGMGASADFRLKMELARQSILIGELFEAHNRRNPVTDDAARAEYDKIKQREGGTEYRARHILVEKEDEAKGLIAQLKGGAKFEDLAKKHSKDPGSGERGGDLDFAKADSYVPEFGQAMARLKKGELTETPVKSQFGWHIIRLDDTREAPFPPFDEVKDQVKRALGQQLLQEYQQSLLKAAKTDYKLPIQN
ncbi:MAG: peptidylprolyl isomerase [Rubrivivax sp.]|jgi:peptidyl-prolyl cis-trans isomerase C|nr:peptidylprolyl isomerase [Rubrivivax sp.]